MVKEALSVAQMCRLYDVDLDHGKHVGALSADLFEQSQSVHQLPAELKKTAYTAGLLHNVALAGGHKKHHTRGRDIIVRHSLTDVPDEERALIAVSTAFHRKKWKPEKLDTEPSYLALKTDKQRQQALVISAVVRIADGLDYSQSQTTIIADAYADDDGMTIEVLGPYLSWDGPRADEKADLWRWLFKSEFYVEEP